MKYIIIFILFSLALNSNSLASKSDSSDSEKTTIIAIDKNINLDQLSKEKYNLFSDLENPETEIPKKKFRNKILKKSGISNEDLKLYDDFEKDLLFLRAKKYTYINLQKNYPSLSKLKLKNLQKNLKKNSK